MRASLILLVILAACSDSSGPRQIPELTTGLSTSVASINRGQLVVTLTASNPSDSTVHLAFYSPPVIVQIKINGEWQAGGIFAGNGFGNTDTLSLTPGATVSLGSANVIFFPPLPAMNVAPLEEPTSEQFSIPSGQYNVRGCYYPSPSRVQGGAVVPAKCGNTLRLTLTP